MRRTIWLILFALLISTGAIAQTRDAIKIGASVTTPYGPLFIVDGTSYNSPQLFEWVQGSSHVVQFPLSLDQNLNPTTYQSQFSDNVRFSFTGWTANTQLFPNQTGTTAVVVADPSLTTLTANVTVQYKVSINFPTTLGTGSSSCSQTINGQVPPPGGQQPPNAPVPTGMPTGVVYVNGTCFADSDSLFVTAGAMTLAAIPYPGWAFYGYLINNSLTSLASVPITGPEQIIPQFSLAKRVDFLTNPPGLRVLVDGSPINTPPAGTAAAAGGTCAPDFTRLPVGAPVGFQPLCFGQFDFLPGSKHTIGAPVPQSDATGQIWIFTGWSNGLGQNATYTPDSNTATPAVLTANFALGVTTSIVTNPAKMKIMIDGRDNWLDYNFAWGAGSTHTISAETPQMDGHARQWKFQNWSDGGAVSHTITVPSTYSFSVTANYKVTPQVTINTNPPGLNLNVGGSSFTTPCVINQDSGTTLTVTAPSSIPLGSGSRYDFGGWSDGAAGGSRTISINQDTLAVTANYSQSYQLTALTNPPKAGNFTLSPPSSDGFYPVGTNVTVTAVANGGFKFAHWEGDLAGTFNGNVLSMTTPHVVQADFATVPFIPPAGIQTVTGPTPDGSIAPGSIIAIYGQNLAPAFLAGTTNPLQQALGGTTVNVGDFLLPLVYVSSTQIGAQVPWELGAGNYTLVVHNTGQPDVTGSFTVTRDAPGVFSQANPLNLPIALAIHADGTLITTDSPAIQGEQITIYGTGFGPYVAPAVDGFVATPTANYLVADPVTVSIGSSQVTPDWAGAAAGIVGVSIVKMTITPDMPSGTNANLTIAVNGKPSAVMVLPLQ